MVFSKAFFREAAVQGTAERICFMIFGRSGQQQAQNPQGNPAVPGGPGGAQQQAPWTGTGGYPVQPSGTGYTGYTPGYPQQGTSYQNGGYAQQGAGYPTGGYAQQGTGYAPGGAAYPQNGQGYGGQSWGQAGGFSYPQGGNGGSAQASQGYAQAQPPYPQGSQGYSEMPRGYTPQQGGYAYPQMNARTPGGSQTGYGYAQGAQNGYAQNGYAQNGYSQGQPGYGDGGYNAYAQMGRNQAPQPGYSQQIPLNGGGYVPPPVPVRKQPFEFKNWMLILLGAVLAVLFAAGTLLRQDALLIVFILLAAASAAFFWIRPLVSGNRRLCYTIIFGVLGMVALLNVLGIVPPRGSSARTPGQGQSQTDTTQAPAGASGGGTVIDSRTGTVISAVEAEQPTATPTAAAEDTSATDKLESFFLYWSANRQDEMLTLCLPSWQSSVDDPRIALYGLMANRTPLDYHMDKISGTSDDTSRTVTVTSTMDRNNGRPAVKYRLSILMVKEMDEWYVDPQSLKSYDEAETPDPAQEATPTPSPEPLVSAGTLLYYNPDGGTKYHLDQNCKSTHAKYLPMKGHFTYSEINDEKYAKLSPCNVCAAPLRP